MKKILLLSTALFSTSVLADTQPAFNPNAFMPAPLNVLNFGAVADAHWGDTTCQWNQGVPVLYCPNFFFSAADVHKSVTLNLSGVNNAPLNTVFSAQGIDAHHMALAIAPSFPNTVSLPTQIDVDQQNSGGGYLPGDTVCVQLNPALPCGTVRVVTLNNIPTVHSGGSSGTAGAVNLMGTSPALGGQPFVVSGNISGGAIVGPFVIIRQGNYDAYTVLAGGEPVVPVIKNQNGTWIQDQSNPLTGATLNVSFGVSPGGVFLTRSQTAVNNFNCPNGTGTTTSGSGTGMLLDCQSIPTTASWGTDNYNALLYNAYPAMQTAIIQNTPKCLYFPAGNYYFSKPTNLQILTRSYVCGDSSYNFPWTSNLFVAPNTPGDMFQLVDCKSRGLQGRGGTVQFSDPTSPLTAGCGIGGVTLVGIRESVNPDGTPAIQNAAMIYGQCLWCKFSFYAFDMRGRAIGTGADAQGNAAVSETIIDQSRFEQMGDVSYSVTVGGVSKVVDVPTVGLVALGTNSTENNVRFLTNRIFQSFGDSVDYINCTANTAAAHNATFGAGLHIEASGMAGTGAGGNLLRFGDLACFGKAFPLLGGGYTIGANPAGGSTGGIRIDGNLTNPQYGWAAVRIDDGNDFVVAGSIGSTGSALGKGLDEEGGCANCNAQFVINGSSDYNYTSQGSGNGNTYNGFGAENNATFNIEASQQPTGPNPTLFPQWTTRPGFTYMSVQNGLVAHAGGGQTNATLLPAGINSVATVGTSSDSTRLMPAAVGVCQYVVNNGGNSMTVWGNTGADTINGAASVSQGAGITAWYCAYHANQWSR